MILITKLISYDNYNSFSGCDVVVSAQMAPINDGASMKTHVLGSLQTISYSTHQDRAPIRAIGNINAIDYVQGQRTIAGTMVFAMFHEHWMTPLLEELESYVSNTDIWSDELPAINLTISMANEYGYKSNMVLYGVKFIDDGGVMSINDLYTENTLQYVATGIQPLKTSGQYQHGYEVKVSPFKISETGTRSFRDIEFYLKEWEESPRSYYKFAFEATIDPSHIVNDFIVKIEPDVKHDITNLYLTDNEGVRHNTYVVEGYHNEFIAQVPTNDYQVSIEDSAGNIYNNVWHIDVSLDNDQENVTVNKDPEAYGEDADNSNIQQYGYADYPVICDIGDTSVKVLANTACDYVHVKKLADDELHADINPDDSNLLKISINTNIGQQSNKEILVENLEPATKYVLNTFNSTNGSYSNAITFRTYGSKKELSEMLQEYVMYNKDIWINEFIPESAFSSMEYEYNNLVDSLLTMQDGDIKTELLFYGVKLQNELNRVYNDDGMSSDIDYVKTKNVDNEFIISDNVDSIVVYKKTKDRSYYVEKNYPTHNYKYIGKPNTHYYLQPTLKSNKKGTRSDFVCFTQSQSEFLENYTDVNNLDKLSIINTSYTYEKYNSELIKAIKAADNLNLYKSLFGEPYAELNGDTLVVDIDYFGSDTKNACYLCIATPEDTVDYTPITKIKIDGKSILNINKYKSRVLRNKYYLIWIQDDSFNNVSPAFILSTYEEDEDIQSYYCDRCKSELNRMVSLFSDSSTYKRYFSNAASVIIAEGDYNYKDLEYTVLQTIYSLYIDSVNECVMDDVFNEVIKTCKGNNYINAKFKQSGDVISFATDNSNAYISCVTVTEDNIIKSAHGNSYNVNEYYKGYSIIFLTDTIYGLTSGCITINNKTKEIYASNITLEVMKDGR